MNKREGKKKLKKEIDVWIKRDKQKKGGKWGKKDTLNRKEDKRERKGQADDKKIQREV